MTITNKMRRQVLENISDVNTGYTTIADILWDTKVEDTMKVMEEYLDSHCDNGHFSRWTSFGNSLYRDAERYLATIENMKKL